MQLLSLDHIHFSVPDLARARELFGPFLGGSFAPVYGGPALNAHGSWNSSGGDFLQVIELGKPVFGGAPIDRVGILSPSFRVADVDAGIAEARAAGLRLRSRIGSEEVGFGRHVIQAQFAPEPSSGLALELVERQIPGDPHRPMTRDVIDHLEHYVEQLDAPVAFFAALFGSPFEPAVEDPAIGARSCRHARLGIQFTAPSKASGATARRIEALGTGSHALAFQCRELARGIARAESLGLVLARRRACGPGAQEAEFEPESGVIVKLVQRSA